MSTRCIFLWCLVFVLCAALHILLASRQSRLCFPHSTWVYTSPCSTAHTSLLRSTFCLDGRQVVCLRHFFYRLFGIAPWLHYDGRRHKRSNRVVRHNDGHRAVQGL